MNTLAPFELAKVLKANHYNEKHAKIYNTLGELWNSHYSYMTNYNIDSGACCTAPTIADVLMWLYKKHHLWILALPTSTGYFAFKIVDVQLNPEKPIERPPYKDVDGIDYNLPSEAYIAGILYVCNNIISYKKN